MWGEHNVHNIITHSPVICVLYVPVIFINANSVKIIIIITILGDAAINIASTARENQICQGEVVTFHCIANGSRLIWMLNSMSQVSFDNLESKEKIIHRPQEDHMQHYYLMRWIVGINIYFTQFTEF